MRAVVALGLVVALLFVLGLFPEGGPVSAQDLQPALPSAPSPSQPHESAPPAGGDEPESNPSESVPPAARPPAFSPSGAGAGTGIGTGTGQGTSAPAPNLAESSFPPPAPLGAVTYENPLKDERVFQAGHCFGQNAMTHYVGEGFRFWATGRCPLLLDESSISVPAKGVTIGDGEVAIDVKVVNGVSRARVSLYVRNVNARMIGAQIQPSKGEASLFTLLDSEQTELASRYDLWSVLKPNDWNRLAVRVSGFDTWLIVNDEPVLYSKDVHADAGQVIIEMIREGDLDDGQEVAVVFRNLTLTALEGGGPDRAPTGP